MPEEVAPEPEPPEIYSTSLEIASVPNTVNYLKGETLDLTGLVVKMNKTDGTSVILSDTDYSVEPAEGTILLEKGVRVVKLLKK